MTVRVRLAPSPTGTLHIGTARTAVFNWLFARHHGGAFLLRIEDTDRERSRPEFTANILAGLRWLGLGWEGEPVVQSERIEAHRAAILQLLESGHAYRCYMSEAELAEMRQEQKDRNAPPRHNNAHRDLSAAQQAAFEAEGREAVIRFRIDDGVMVGWSDLVRGEMRWSGADLGGDMVIARRAPASAIGDPLYNLVVVVDDAAMAISHVIRGEDHIANTAKQLLLYEALELPLPVFAHTPLILNAEGRKLSKRDGVTSVAEFQGMGYTPEALVNYMTLLGWSPPEGMGERFNLSEAAAAFGFERVNRAGARFDWDKLNWLNSQVLHARNPAALLDELLPLWQAEGWRDASDDQAWGEELAGLLGPSMVTLQDGVAQARPFFEWPGFDAAATAQLAQPEARSALTALLEALPAADHPLAEDTARDLLAGAASGAGVKKGVLMKSLRAALLGSLQGPDLLTTWCLLHPRGEDRSRLERSLGL